VTLILLPATKPDKWAQFAEEQLRAVLMRRFQLPEEPLLPLHRKDLEKMLGNGERVARGRMTNEPGDQ
jgi:hypothetical protein